MTQFSLALLATILKKPEFNELIERLPNISTILPNDHLQCLCCVLTIYWRAIGACSNVDLNERLNPLRATLPFIVPAKGLKGNGLQEACRTELAALY